MSSRALWCPAPQPCDTSRSPYCADFLTPGSAPARPPSLPAPQCCPSRAWLLFFCSPGLCRLSHAGVCSCPPAISARSPVMPQPGVAAFLLLPWAVQTFSRRGLLLPAHRLSSLPSCWPSLVRLLFLQPWPPVPSGWEDHLPLLPAASCQNPHFKVKDPCVLDIKFLIDFLQDLGSNFLPPPDWTQPSSFCGSHFLILLFGFSLRTLKPPTSY